MTTHDYSEERIQESLKTGRTFRMHEASKGRMRAALSSYADLHAVATPSPFDSAFSFTSIIFSRRSVYAFVAIILLITTGAGTTYASEGSLPGDVLYPVKVSIAEPLQGALIPTVQGKAAWHATLAERRLDEATALAASHTLDATTSAYLAAQFNMNVEASMQEADSLARAGDTDDSMHAKDDLEATVTAHAAILGLVADAEANTAVSSTTPASTTAQEVLAINDIASVVVNTRKELVTSRIRADKNEHIGPLSVATRTTASTTAAIDTATTSSLSIATTAREKIVADSAVSQANRSAREEARAAVISTIVERNQTLLRKLGITASTTASSTLPEVNDAAPVETPTIASSSAPLVPLGNI